jgi:hypothetical protein
MIFGIIYNSYVYFIDYLCSVEDVYLFIICAELKMSLMCIVENVSCALKKSL